MKMCFGPGNLGDGIYPSLQGFVGSIPMGGLHAWLLIQVPCGGSPGCLSLNSRSHCLFLQNSYCRGVQCVCFSMDDNYVYAGLKDRSIIVWSVQDGESFCFEGKIELRS